MASPEALIVVAVEPWSVDLMRELDAAFPACGKADTSCGTRRPSQIIRNTPGCNFYRVYVDGVPAFFFVAGERSGALHVSFAFGWHDRVRFVDHIDPLVCDIARRLGLSAVTFETRRAGLQAKCRRAGYAVQSVVMRKDL